MPSRRAARCHDESNDEKEIVADTKRKAESGKVTKMMTKFFETIIQLYCHISIEL